MQPCPVLPDQSRDAQPARCDHRADERFHPGTRPHPHPRIPAQHLPIPPTGLTARTPAKALQPAGRPSLSSENGHLRPENIVPTIAVLCSSGFRPCDLASRPKPAAV